MVPVAVLSVIAGLSAVVALAFLPEGLWIVSGSSQADSAEVEDWGSYHLPKNWPWPGIQETDIPALARYAARQKFGAPRL